MSIECIEALHSRSHSTPLLKYITKYFASYEITNTRANSYPSCFSLLQKFIAKCVFEITKVVIWV
jgi:hypothetical protein